MARLEEAEQLVRQGLEMERRHLPPDHPAVAKALLAVGKVLAQRGSYDQAIQALNEAVRIESAPGAAPADLAASIVALAEAYYSAGHLDVCNTLYHQVLGMHRKLYGDHHPLVADDLENLAAVQQDLGFYSEGERFHWQALEINESYYGKDHPKVAASLTGLGQAFTYENKFDEAEAVLQRALAIQQRVYGPTHPAVADALNELGSLASMRNHLDEAEARFRSAAEVYRSVYGDHHYLVAIALSNVASIYMDKKDYPRAEQLFHDVIRRFNETLGPDNVNTGIARLKLGRTLLREKRYKESEVECLAGYENLIKQTSQSTSFIRGARKDLIADYEALNEPEKAARFKGELAAAAANTPAAK